MASLNDRLARIETQLAQVLAALNATPTHTTPAAPAPPTYTDRTGCANHAQPPNKASAEPGLAAARQALDERTQP